MPYIHPRDRAALAAGQKPANAGQLNYAVTKLVDEYLGGERNYTSINEVVGVLECAKLELYRRVAAPYESTKLALNGDVYDQPK